MARYGGIWRICCGWLLLCCLLPSVEAATRSVNYPSISDQLSKGSASLSDSVLTLNTAIEGEFIPAATKNVPVRGILGGTTFGLNTIKGAARGVIGGGVAAVVTGLAFDQLIKGLDWVMGDGGLVKNVPGPPVQTVEGNYAYAWNDGIQFSSAQQACQVQADSQGWVDLTISTRDNGNHFQCNGRPKGGVGGGEFATVTRVGNGCPTGSTFSGATGSCNSDKKTTAPIVEADYIKMDQFIDAQNSEFVKNLLKESCLGSNNPNGCYLALRKEQLKLKGPASVDAGTTTTTTTHANTDGTTSKIVTTVNTKYNIVYGPTNFNYTKNTTSTTSTDGKPGDTSTEEESPSDETDPEDDPADDEVKASPCASNCDGPAYKTLYKKTTDTKEQALDSYASKVAAIPLFAAVGGYFTVTANAGCPVWESPVNFAVMGSSFAYDLVFDFHCQSWFTATASYASIVMMIVCSFLAFRQAFLD